MSNNTRRGFSPVLAFILGFLLAVVILAGSVAVAVAVALNYKLDKISANKDSEGNYIYINADVNNGGVGTVMDLVKKLASMGKNYSNLSLGEMEELIPVVGKLTDSLEKTLSEFVKLEEGELEAVKFGELSEFIGGIIDKVDLVSLLDAPPENAILAYMCLKVTNVVNDAETGVWTAKYKDEQGTVHDCVIELDENGKLQGGYYLEDEEKIALPPISLDNVSQRAKGVTHDLTLGEILKIDDGDRILGSVKNSTIDTLAADFNKLSVQQLFADDIYGLVDGEDGSVRHEPLFYQAVEGVTPSADPVYNADYIYYTLEDDGSYKLAGGYGKLKAAEFSARTYYTLGEGKILFDSSFVYYEQAESGYVLVNEGGDDRGRVLFYSGDVYYTYGAPTPLWKILLYVAEDDGVRREQVYSVNNITAMIDNVTKNTQTTLMRELHAAGILVFDDPAELERTLVWYESGVRHEEVIGDMTLLEVINVMLYVSKNPTALIDPSLLPSS